mgnify:CR=1 FL=1|tara:strand:+ start:3947 stop:4639 length:693 start_codon:yes stop_codon:yes gene_type:complete
MGRVILLGILVLGAIGFFYFDLSQYLSLENLKEKRDRLYDLYEADASFMILSFIGVYIIIVALSLPGATILTLTGGAVFGTCVGTLVVNVGATLGATLAFLLSRYLMRNWVVKKFGENLKTINVGIAKNGINYILFLRIVPLFPFFLINLVSGLTLINWRVYFFGTMFGTLPGTFVYANAGNNIAAINSLDDIASPGFLTAFVLLGVFSLIPIIYKNLRSKNKDFKSAAI